MNDFGAAPAKGLLVAKLRRAAALGATAAALAQAAQAAPPLATEDADVLGARSCELEASAARAGAARANSAQLGCGVGLRSQLAVGHARESSAGTPARETAVSGKTSLWQSDDAGFGLALAWTRSARHQADEPSERSSSVNLVASGPLADHLTVDANLRWGRSHADRQNRTAWNLAATLPLDARVDAVAELYGDDRHSAGTAERAGRTHRHR